MKGVRCNSINDFSEYFREQLEGARSNLNVSVNSLKKLESQLNELGDPRSNVSGFEMLIKNRIEEVEKLSKEIEIFPKKRLPRMSLRLIWKNTKPLTLI